MGVGSKNRTRFLQSLFLRGLKGRGVMEICATEKKFVIRLK